MSGDDALPAALGRYQPIEQLGSGAMGRVYLAVDPLIDRLVAVKVINTDLLDPAGRDDFLQRFRTEVRAAAHCAHPTIVNVYDFADDGPMPYIVMEHVPGSTLAALMRGPPAERDAPALAAMVLQVLEGLGAAHAVGVVHRDIKPGNIMVTPRGAVKITDFGIARLGDSAMTMVGGMIGSPGYMAPEQAMGQGVDHRTDLFATAAVLYEILFGRTPFGGSNITETLVRLTGPAPAEIGGLEGTAMGHVLRRGLAKDMRQRFSSAADFAASLRQALRDGAEDATRILPAAVAEQAPPSLSGSLPFTTVAIPQQTPPFELPAAMAARMTEELAFVVGPIARVLLRKAASGARDLPDLIDRLCASLEPAEATALRKRLTAAGERGR
ncbi:serine/threonine-protein kinase [Roseomonas sp. F4]